MTAWAPAFRRVMLAPASRSRCDLRQEQEATHRLVPPVAGKLERAALSLPAARSIVRLMGPGGMQVRLFRCTACTESGCPGVRDAALIGFKRLRASLLCIHCYRTRAARSEDMGRTALLVIDMQNDFCLPGAVLCVNGAMGCLPKVIEAVALARAQGYDVVWVVREHDASGECGLAGARPPQLLTSRVPAGIDVELFREPMFRQGKSSTVRGTEGAALVSGLSILPGEHSIVKTRFSAFFGTHLDMLLRCVSKSQFDHPMPGYQGQCFVVQEAWNCARDFDGGTNAQLYSGFRLGRPVAGLSSHSFGRCHRLRHAGGPRGQSTRHAGSADWHAHGGRVGSGLREMTLANDSLATARPLPLSISRLHALCARTIDIVSLQVLHVVLLRFSAGSFACSRWAGLKSRIRATIVHAYP